MPAATTPPRSASQGPLTKALAGLVGWVTYHDVENGFCVLRVKARGQRDLVTVVGHAASISAGEWVQLSGTWINDLSRWAAKPIISRRNVASKPFSRSSRRAILSPVIVVSMVLVRSRQPNPTEDHHDGRPNPGGRFLHHQ